MMNTTLFEVKKLKNLFFDHISFLVERGISCLDDEDERQNYEIKIEVFLKLVKYVDFLIESIQNNDELFWNITKEEYGDTPEFKLFLSFIKCISLWGSNEEQTEQICDELFTEDANETATIEIKN